MLSLLPRLGPSPGGIIHIGSVARRLAPKRSHAIRAATNVSGGASGADRSLRPPSRYAVVDHAAAYRESLAGAHGAQLRLALEEGRGKDAEPFDPFSQFLDQMGSAGAEGDGEEAPGEEVLEAEYEEYEREDGDEGDEGGDEEQAEGGPPLYNTDGSLRRPKSEWLALRAGYPAGGQFAVILLAGFQHKVRADDLLVVNKLRPVAEWSIGSVHTLRDDAVLLVANQDKTLVGVPGVRGAEVDLMVEEITRDKTLIVFKKRRRKHSRRKKGHRRQVTFLRVLDVRMPAEEVARDGEEGSESVSQNERVAA